MDIDLFIINFKLSSAAGREALEKHVRLHRQPTIPLEHEVEVTEQKFKKK